MVFVFLCLDDVPILSNVVVVHSVVHFKTLQFPTWWKSNFWRQQEGQAAVYLERRIRFYPANFKQNILFGPFQQLYELSSYCEI